MSVTINEQIANYREARALMIQSVADVDARIEALLSAEKLLQQDVTLALPKFGGQEHPSRFIPTQAEVKIISQPAVDTSSISACMNIPEAMFAWADAHDGEVRGKELARALRILGLSKAKNVASAAATIHNFAVKAYSEHWEKVGPNHFRRMYPGNEEAAEPENNVHEQGHEHDPDQTLAAD